MREVISSSEWVRSRVRRIDSKFVLGVFEIVLYIEIGRFNRVCIVVFW